MEVIYDDDGAIRKSKGSKGASVFHNAKDPNHLVVLSEWENIERAKNFAESEDLVNTMQKQVLWADQLFFTWKRLKKQITKIWRLYFIFYFFFTVQLSHKADINFF